MYRVSKETIGFSILLLLLILVLFTGCSVNIPVVSESDYYGKRMEVSKSEEYTPLETFEYTVDNLKQLNEKMGYTDFDITYDNGITIDGYISSRGVNSAEDALENITMIRSILGLINPKEQLKQVNSDNSFYSFYQYYNGLRVDFARINVNIDEESRLITYITSDIVPIETLKKVSFNYILSEEGILADTYKGKTVKEKVIWANEEYREKPVVAYILSGDDMITVVNAHDGTYIDSWSTIITTEGVK